jgi:hypothetical protein
MRGTPATLLGDVRTQLSEHIHDVLADAVLGSFGNV